MPLTGQPNRGTDSARFTDLHALHVQCKLGYKG